MLRKDVEREANAAAIRTGKKVQNGRGSEVQYGPDGMWMNEDKLNAKYPPGKPGGKANG
jgi:hypothetical protein